jgi:hypothetical protein
MLQFHDPYIYVSGHEYGSGKLFNKEHVDKMLDVEFLDFPLFPDPTDDKFEEFVDAIKSASVIHEDPRVVAVIREKPVLVVQVMSSTDSTRVHREYGGLDFTEFLFNRPSFLARITADLANIP